MVIREQPAVDEEELAGTTARCTGAAGFKSGPPDADPSVQLKLEGVARDEGEAEPLDADPAAQLKPGGVAPDEEEAEPLDDDRVAELEPGAPARWCKAGGPDSTESGELASQGGVGAATGACRGAGT